MSWLTDPQLFLYIQGGVVQVWKCKEMSSVQPMKRTDLDYVSDVKDHDNLLEGILVWKKPHGYQALIDYISPRHLLVNSQGLVISEVHGFSKDGKINVNTADHSIYIRSLDVISLNTFIERIRQRIPFRTVQYLEAAAATETYILPVEPSPKELKLEADIKQANNEKQGLEKILADSEAKNKNLEGDIKQANNEKQGLEKRLTDSEAKNKNLEGDIKRSMTDLETTKNEKKVLEKKKIDLEEAIKKMTTPPMFRICTKADTGYSLTIRGGQVVLGPNNPADVAQYWVKYGTAVRDRDGRPSFALVNSFTGQAIQSTQSNSAFVKLIPYHPRIVDESIMWTELALNDGYSHIRTVYNLGLVLDAEKGDKNHPDGGGVHEGTRVLNFGWITGENQKWKIAPSASPINIPLYE